MNLFSPTTRLQIKDFYLKHERWAPLTFFCAGFLFDIVTLSRIDDTFGLFQQAFYLVLIGSILSLSHINYQPTHPRLLKVWPYRDEVLSFFLGSLLSLYTLFYFKASSLFTSFIFLILLSFLLYINEAKRIWGVSRIIPMILFFLCLDSYFICLIPILTGEMGVLSFLGALLIATLLCYPIFYILKSYVPARSLWLPFVLTQSIFIGLYFTGLIPPVPLSLNAMGIYRDIKKENDHFILTYTRPWWKFWQNGDQTFLARPGDKIVYYVRIFSPGGLNEKINVRWSMKGKYQWEPQDAIPIEINGGRDEGFRGHTIKQNYSPGDWRVQVETDDGRELGRMYFSIETDTSNEFREMHQFVD